jgi:hypothetical protein
MSEKYRRRSVLKYIGSATTIGALSTVGGTTIATEEENGTTMHEAGVKDEFDRLFKLGEFQEAISLLEANGVKYSATKTSLDSFQESPGGISPQDDLDKGDTFLWLCGGERREDVYGATLGWNPSRTGDLLDCSGPKDVVGISFSDDRWRFIPGSDDLGEYTDNFNPNPEGCTARYSDEAVIAGFDDPQYMMIELEKMEEGDANIYGHYSHNWDPYCVGGGSVSFGIQAGALQVSVDGLDHWEKSAPTMVR